MAQRINALWRGLVCLALLAGCGRGPAMGQVDGLVTYNGQPVTNGTVLFVPESPGPGAQGTLDERGKFKLTTYEPGDGALAGPHRVAIVPPTDFATLNAELKPGRMQRATTYDNIPSKVRDHRTSEIRIEIKPGERTPVVLELGDDAAM